MFSRVILEFQVYLFIQVVFKFVLIAYRKIDEVRLMRAFRLPPPSFRPFCNIQLVKHIAKEVIIWNRSTKFICVTMISPTRNNARNFTRCDAVNSSSTEIVVWAMSLYLCIAYSLSMDRGKLLTIVLIWMGTLMVCSMIS